MEIDIRKIRCGGWNSSHMNVKVNGRWRYLFKPNKLKPLNVQEPIDFTGGYKPPVPAPSVTRYIQNQQMMNNEIISNNRASINIPIAGSTLKGSQVEKDHPTKKRFLMNNAVNKPKAPYSFCQKDKKLRNSYNVQSPPVMSNENFIQIHEQNKKKARTRRFSHSAYIKTINRIDIQKDTLSDFTDLAMTQSSFSTSMGERSLALTAPPPSISNNAEDSIYFMTEPRTQSVLNHATSSRSQQFIISEFSRSKIHSAKEKRNRSINGHSKPLMKFKCMVRPQVDSSFRGDTSNLEGIEVTNNLPEDVKNYFIEAKERQKRLQEEQEYQNYQDYYNNYDYY